MLMEEEGCCSRGRYEDQEERREASQDDVDGLFLEIWCIVPLDRPWEAECEDYDVMMLIW